MSIIIKRTVSTLILFFPLFVFSQIMELQEVLSQFDQYNFERVAELIEDFDEAQLNLQTKNDSVEYAFFNLIRFNALPANELSKNNDLQTEYYNQLTWLEASGLEKYLPYFYNHYAYTYNTNRDYQINCLAFLKKTVEIEENDWNMSHLESTANLFDALKLIDIILTQLPGEEYKDEYLQALVELYNEKSEHLSLRPETMITTYTKATRSKHLSDSLRIDSAKRAFEIISSMDTMDIGQSIVPALLSDIRIIESKQDKYEFLNFVQNSYGQLISEIERKINLCYINHFDKKSLKSFKASYDVQTPTNENNPRTDLNISQCILKFFKKVNDEVDRSIKANYDPEFWFEGSDLWYNYLVKTKQSKSLITSALYNLKVIIDNYGYEVSEIESNNLTKRMHDLTMELVTNDKASDVLPSQLMTALKYRLISRHQEISVTEVETDMRNILTAYTSQQTYENIIEFLDLYWSFNVGLIGKFDLTALKGLKQIIQNELSKDLSKLDLPLRISLCLNSSELDSLEEEIGDFMAGNNPEPNVKLRLLERRFFLQNNRKSVMDLYDYILDNAINKTVKYYIVDAMTYAVEWQLTSRISELSNLVLINFNEDFESKTDMAKYYFQLAAGKFYQYINRNDQAIFFYIQARANNFHWKEGLAVDELLRDYYLIHTIFDLYVTSNNIKDAKKYYQTYVERISDLSQVYSEVKVRDDRFKNIFEGELTKLQRMNHDMSRRIGLLEENYSRIEEEADAMIAMEQNTPYYGMNQLYYFKLNAQIAQGKITQLGAKNVLDSIYVAEKREFNDQYFLWLGDLGVRYKEYFAARAQQLKIQLDKISVITDLSFENQIQAVKKIVISLRSLEELLFFRNSEKSQENISLIANYRLIVDNIDNYNSKLLNLNDKDADQYFKYLNERYNVKDFDSLTEVIRKFDIFQQDKKSAFVAQDAVDLDSFQKKLLPNQAYVRLLELKDSISIKYMAYVLTRSKVDALTVFHRDLSSAVNYYQGRTQNKQTDHISYNLFFKQIDSMLPKTINQVFLKNDGVFNNVNIESLWNPNSNQFVFDYRNINYVERPSSIFKINTPVVIENAFLFGNPNFYGTYQPLETSNNSEERAGLDLLPYTKEEVAAINEILLDSNINTIINDFDQSTEQSFYQNINSSLVHVATHGFLIKGNYYDRFNYGVLAAGARNILRNDFQKEPRNDGVIFGGEIILKNMTKTELVVLSACETGIGTTGVFGGENLATAFLRAGAKNIISTLWPVDDKITHEFMQKFYENLILDMNISKALRRTKHVMKEKYSEPYYWAPFVLTQNKL